MNEKRCEHGIRWPHECDLCIEQAAKDFAHEAETPATGHAEREAMREAYSDMLLKAPPVEETPLEYAFEKGWQAGRAARDAEIRAGGVKAYEGKNGSISTYQDKVIPPVKKLYRLLEGE